MWKGVASLFLLLFLLAGGASAGSVESIDLTESGQTFVRKDNNSIYIIVDGGMAQYNITSTEPIKYVGDVKESSAWEYTLAGTETIKSDKPLEIKGNYICRAGDYSIKGKGLAKQETYSDCAYYKPSYVDIIDEKTKEPLIDEEGNIQKRNLVNMTQINAYTIEIGFPDNYDPEITNLTLSLVSCWGLENNISDTHGGYDGDSIGTPDYITGKIGTGMYFSGSNEGIRINDSANDPYDNIAEFTVSYWQNATDKGSGGSRMAHLNNAWGVFMEQQFEDEMRFRVNADSNTEVDDNDDNAYGVWTMYTFSWVAGNYSFYRNGTLYYSEAANSGSVDDVSENLYFGIDEDESTSEYIGQMDEIAFWNRKLNSSEILQLYNNSAGMSCAEIAATGRAEAQTEYYFSTTGDDSNDGTSGNPKKTITELNTISLNAGDTVYFNRGDTWRFDNDTWISLDSGSSAGYITYTAYGEGDKPMFLGSKISEVTSCWEEIESNVWEYNCSLSLDVGNLIMNDSNNHGQRNWSIEQIKKEGQGYYTFNDTPNALYLYSTSNPVTLYGDIEIALGDNLFDINSVSYVIIDNLSMKWSGRHGIEGQNNHHILITNNELSYIGGEYQTGSYTRYGNGIQFWEAGYDNLAEYNRIWEVYDAALTNQGSSGSDYVSYNITYRYNEVWNSSYCFEYFQSDYGSNANKSTFDHNTCYNLGAGWYNPQRVNFMDGVCFRSGNSVENFTSGINFTNNICHTTNEWLTEDYMIRFNDKWEGWQKDENLTIDYNLYYNYNDYFALWGPNSWTKYATLAAYQSATSKDANSAEGDPLFISTDSGNSDFLVPYNDSPACSMSSSGSYVGALPCSASGSPYNDTSPPVINITDPLDGYNRTAGNQHFTFRVDDNSSIDYCDLRINGTIETTNTSIDVNASNMINHTFPNNGTFTAQIFCNDSNANWGNSSNNTIVINESIWTDEEAPNVTLLTPPNASEYILTDSEVHPTLNVTANDNVAVSNATLHMWNATSGATYTYKVDYYPDTIANTTGWYLGSVENLSFVDGSFLEIREVVGAPGFDFVFEWDGVNTKISQYKFEVRALYNGVPAHIVSLSYWNYSSSAWVQFGTITDGDVVTEYSTGLLNTTDVVSNGAVKLSVNHSQSGNQGDILYLDYIEVHTKIGELVTINLDDGGPNGSRVTLPNGTFLWNYNVTDTSGNYAWYGDNFTLFVTTSTVPPNITFIPPTPANGSTVQVNYTTINVTVNEISKSVVLEWNGTNETMNFSSPYEYHSYKTNLENKVYYYKVYATDMGDNTNSTATWQVSINYTVPYPLPNIDSIGNTTVTNVTALIYVNTNVSTNVTWNVAGTIYNHTGFALNHTLNLSGLSINTTYFWNVTVYNTDGNSTTSENQNFTTNFIGEPEPAKSDMYLYIAILPALLILFVLGQHYDDPIFHVFTGILSTIICVDMFINGVSGVTNTFLVDGIASAFAGIGFYYLVWPSLKYLIVRWEQWEMGEET